MRSYLFVPANEPRKIAKGLQSAADALILDLEDAVARTHKAAARSSLAETFHFLREEARDKEEFDKEWNRRICLRINPPATGWGEDDLRLAASLSLSWIMLPKADSVREIEQLAADWAGLADRPIRLIPLIETALGVERALDIAQANDCVSRLALGTIDLSGELGIEVSEDQLEFLYARSRLVMASAASGLPGPIDSAEPVIDSPERLLSQARTAKKLGFSGKMAIHPKQLPPIHEAWRAGEAEKAAALRIVAAFEKAQRNGVAAIEVDGRMVDYPVYEQALKRLKP